MRAIDAFLALKVALDVDVGVIIDETTRGLPIFSMTLSQASMQSPHWMQAKLCAVADIDARWDTPQRTGRNPHNPPQADPSAARAFIFLQRAARFTAILAIGDVERPFVGQRRLNARPGAHIDANLLPHVAGHDIGC